MDYANARLLVLAIASCGASMVACSDHARTAQSAAGAGTGTGGAREQSVTGSGGERATATGGAGSNGTGRNASASGESGSSTNRDAGLDAADLDAGTEPASTYLFVSGYGPEISVLRFDEASGAAMRLSSVTGPTAPSYLALSPDKRRLYAIDENNGAASRVFAFSIAASDGHLTSLNNEASGGNGAPYLTVHPSGNWLAVAHYSSGQTSILPIMADGRVGPPSDVEQGPNNGCQNAHEAVFDRNGTHLFVPCLGSNYVVQYSFDAGKLRYNTPATVAVSGGPRHLAFDSSYEHAYVLSETESTITSFDYDAGAGTLSNPATIPSYMQQKGASAHIELHPNGKWLYASNRGENTIGEFTFDANGRPRAAGFVHDMLATPRDFAIDESGAFLVAANQEGAQNLLVYSIRAGDGSLELASMIAIGGSPSCVKLATLAP